MPLPLSLLNLIFVVLNISINTERKDRLLVLKLAINWRSFASSKPRVSMLPAGAQLPLIGPPSGWVRLLLRKVQTPEQGRGLGNPASFDLVEPLGSVRDLRR